MADSRETITDDEIPALLEVLDGDDAAAQCRVLTRLCPCRSRCLDSDAWLTIVHAHEWSPDDGVRNRARHALDTLREQAETDTEARALADWLRDRDDTGRLSRSARLRVTSRTLGRLIAILDGDDTAAQCDVLHHLCPCRNRRYDKEVWRAIFHVYERTDDASVRDAAHHAIGTLGGRVRTDPRSQALVQALAGDSPTAAELESAVPVWNPRGSRADKGLPAIPRFERSHRCKANKPR